MTKACASIVIFLALFAIVGAEEFQSLSLNQGSLRLRNLDTSTLKSYAFDNFTNNTAVKVNFGSAYLNAIGRPETTQTDMVLFLYTNATGFARNSNQFIAFGCDLSVNNCSMDKSQPQTSLGPHYNVFTGYPFSFSSLSIGSDTPSWQLKTTAMFIDTVDPKDIYMPSTNLKYLRESETYGFIGLGIGGDASKNFQTANPIFSLQVNTSGVGSLIFGKNTSLYDSSRTPQVFTTNTNWTMTSKNFSLGPLINSTAYVSNVIFDLQHPGIGFPYSHYDNYPTNMLTKFRAQYNLTSDRSYGNIDYSYVFKGNLSSLPNLVFGLTNDKNITLPPSAYTRKAAENVYVILMNYVYAVENKTSKQDVDFTILGNCVLSQFYTVFEQQANAQPTVTLYPTFDAAANGHVDPSNPSNPSSSSSSLKTIAIIAAVVLIVLVALSAVCKKKAEFSKSDLGVELRAARV